MWASYSLFYIIGTFLAIQVPVVGWAPLKSLEQLGPLGLFVGFQVLQLMRILEAKYSKVNKWKVRGMVVLAGIVLALPIVYWLYTVGYFGPISSRVRGLFVKHTKTGNQMRSCVETIPQLIIR